MPKPMLWSADGLGFSASLLCAIHCAFLPTLASLAPLLGLDFLAHHAVEWAIVCLSVVVGGVALVPGYLRIHHKVWAIALFLSGMALIVIGHWKMPEGWHLPFVVTGASTVAISHLVNWRLAHAQK